MDYQKITENVYAEVKLGEDKGQVAQYIPELRNVSPHHFGVHVSTLDGYDVGTGDNHTKFSIQSIAKVFSLTLAFGNIENDIEPVLDLYFCMCSIEMTCRELSRGFSLSSQRRR